MLQYIMLLIQDLCNLLISSGYVLCEYICVMLYQMEWIRQIVK